MAVSINLDSMRTWRVAVSSFATKAFTLSSSFSVVVMISWLVRGSATTELRGDKVALMSATIVVGSLYRIWMMRDTRGSSALGSRMVMRAIFDFWSLISIRL